ARARALELSLELLVPAEQLLERYAAVIEDHLGGMGGADSELRLLLALAQSGRALRHDERRLAAVAERRVDRRDDDVDVRDARAPPVHLLGVDRPDDPVGVRPEALDEVDSLEPLPPGRLEHLPRRRFLAVVLGRDRPDDLSSEAPALGLELELLVGIREVHRGFLLIDQS